jgi:CheY-like chemotaxis protein
VFLDVMMPKMNGFDVCDTVKHKLNLEGIYIVMLTAKGQAKDREQAEQAGVNRYMTKPFSNVEVVKAVRDLIHVHAR